MKNLTPAQRTFLRRRLGPTLTFKVVPAFVGLGFKIQARVAAIPEGQPKPELEPFSLALAFGLLAPMGRIASTIRQGVAEGQDPETVKADVTAEAAEILRILLTDETEDSVLSLYTFINGEVDRIFSETDLWDLLNDAEDVFDPAPKKKPKFAPDPNPGRR